MTTDVFDRLLEHALRDELAPPAPAAADLAARVAAALAGDATLPAPARSVQPRDERARRRWLPFAIAAAAALGVALLWATAKQPGLACSRPLLLAAADDQPFAVGEHVASASVAWCAGAAPVVLTGADGATTVAAPGSAFAIDPRRCGIELFTGTIELRGRAPWRVDARLAAGVTVRLGDGGAVRCTLTPDIPPPTHQDPTMTPNDLRARLRNLSVPATLTVLVLAGSAELATAQGKETLPNGSTRTIDASGERAVRMRTRQLFEAVRKELPRPTDEASTAAWQQQEDGFHELLDLVQRQPAAAAMLRQALVIELGNARLAAEPRARLLQLALLDEDATTFAAAARAWESNPDAFGLEEQIALAERGHAPAMTKLRESITKVRGIQVGRLFAALTAGGDGSARPAMARFLAASVADAAKDLQRFDARCHAAVALQSLGDPAPVRELRTALIAQVEAWVAAGDAQQLALADTCLQRAEYWLVAPQPRLSWPEIRQRAAAKLGGAPDAASLRARAAALTVK